MTTVELLRNMKPHSIFTDRCFLISSGIFFLLLIFSLFYGQPGIAALHAASFASSLLAFYGSRQQRMMKDLLDEIDKLRGLETQKNQRQE